VLAVAGCRPALVMLPGGRCPRRSVCSGHQHGDELAATADPEPVEHGTQVLLQCVRRVAAWRRSRRSSVPEDERRRGVAGVSPWAARTIELTSSVVAGCSNTTICSWPSSKVRRLHADPPPRLLGRRATADSTGVSMSARSNVPRRRSPAPARRSCSATRPRCRRASARPAC
jgi:hypothetical protein